MRLVLAGVLLLGAVASARAEINIVDSLEWMAVDAPLVLRGKVSAVEDIRGPGDVTYQDITVAIQETVKGKVDGKTVQVRLRLLGSDGAGKDWKASGHSFLFFLRQGEAADDRSLGGRWVPRESQQSVIDLDQPGKVYKADMTLARTAEEILTLTRQYAARKQPPRGVGAPNVFKAQQGFLRLEIPPDAEIYRHVYAGSVCYLNVPAEEKYRPLALAKARSANVQKRVEGADMLRNFPGKETVQLLTALLNDPGEARTFSGPGQLVEITYPVRLAAYDALLALGEQPEKPLLKRKPTEEELRREREESRK